MAQVEDVMDKSKPWNAKFPWIIPIPIILPIVRKRSRLLSVDGEDPSDDPLYREYFEALRRQAYADYSARSSSPKIRPTAGAATGGGAGLEETAAPLEAQGALSEPADVADPVSNSSEATSEPLAAERPVVEKTKSAWRRPSWRWLIPIALAGSIAGLSQCNGGGSAKPGTTAPKAVAPKNPCAGLPIVKETLYKQIDTYHDGQLYNVQTVLLKK